LNTWQRLNIENLKVKHEVKPLVNEEKGRLFRRKDGKFLIYMPKDLAEDSMFPFRTLDSIKVKVTFKLSDDKMLIEKWKEQ
jgi:hypothetical protein